ncbi:hypothetical protein [Rhodococcus gordoniae]
MDPHPASTRRRRRHRDHAQPPLIRSWPGQSAHKRAVAGLDVLAQIGTDTALLHLHAISEKLKFPALKTAAQDKVEQIAVDLGLTTDQLGDRLAPTFDLDAPDALHLNYGPRSFTLDFDEHLRPILYDAGQQSNSPTSSSTTHC